MRSKRRVRAAKAPEVEVQRQIRDFVLAMASYPERVARQPELSLQEHCGHLAAQKARGPAHSTGVRGRLARARVS